MQASKDLQRRDEKARKLEESLLKANDREVKQNQYLEELGQDLRDAKEERRQLVKMLDRYTQVRDGGVSSGHDQGRAEGYACCLAEGYACLLG